MSTGHMNFVPLERLFKSKVVYKLEICEPCTKLSSNYMILIHKLNKGFVK